jgi:hypothetical protein
MVPTSQGTVWQLSFPAPCSMMWMWGPAFAQQPVGHEPECQHRHAGHEPECKPIHVLGIFIPITNRINVQTEHGLTEFQ